MGKIRKTGTDIFGVRGAVCSGEDREASLERDRVKKIVPKIKKIKDKK